MDDCRLDIAVPIKFYQRHDGGINPLTECTVGVRLCLEDGFAREEDVLNVRFLETEVLNHIEGIGFHVVDEKEVPVNPTFSALARWIYKRIGNCRRVEIINPLTSEYKLVASYGDEDDE
jgi:hypothetical protein